MSLHSRFALPLSLAAALLLAAAPASADSWKKHHKHHHKHAKHHWKHGGGHGGHGHHGGHRHHDGCGHHGYGGYYAPSYVVEHHSYGYPVYHYPAERYYCGPCSHYFGSYDLLSHHVHHQHAIAVVAVPSVIFQASIGGGAGWVFGY